MAEEQTDGRKVEEGKELPRGALGDKMMISRTNALTLDGRKKKDLLFALGSLGRGKYHAQKHNIPHRKNK